MCFLLSLPVKPILEARYQYGVSNNIGSGKEHIIHISPLDTDCC